MLKLVNRSAETFLDQVPNRPSVTHENSFEVSHSVFECDVKKCEHDQMSVAR